jgi:hypothetical protein
VLDQDITIGAGGLETLHKGLQVENALPRRALVDVQDEFVSFLPLAQGARGFLDRGELLGHD